jgi:uncharacterized protein YjbI with pentapeptide repeats
LTVSALDELMRFVGAVPCEFCDSVALSNSNLCRPCFVDFQAAEFEGVELTRADFEAADVLGVRR